LEKFNWFMVLKKLFVSIIYWKLGRNLLKKSEIKMMCRNFLCG